MNWIHFIPAAGFLAIVVLIAARVLFLKQKGIRVSPGSKTNDGKKRFLYFIFLIILVIWLYELAKPIVGFTVEFFPPAISKPFVSSFILDIAGVALILTSVAFLTLTLLHFRQSLRFGLDKNNQARLITSGIFSISRNPFFLSLDLYFAGTALIFPNLFFTGFAIAAIVSIHFFILKEERFLSDSYGEEYNSYFQKVKRYFGKN